MIASENGRSDITVRLAALAIVTIFFIYVWNEKDGPAVHRDHLESIAQNRRPSVAHPRRQANRLDQSTRLPKTLAPAVAAPNDGHAGNWTEATNMNPQIVAAEIAGIVALIVAIGQVFASWSVAKVTQASQERIKLKELSHATAWDVAKTALDFKFRQLNDLYGPALALASQSKMLAERLRRDKEKGWHLLRSIEAVKIHAGDWALVKQILKANLMLRKLLLKHAGLVMPEADSGQIPLCITKFLNHIALVESAVLNGKSLQGVADFEVYPSELDDHLLRARDRLWTDLSNTLQTHERTLQGILSNKAIIGNVAQ